MITVCLSADRLPNVYRINVPWFREDSLTTVRLVMSASVSKLLFLFLAEKVTYSLFLSWLHVICLSVCRQWLRSQGCSIQVVQTTPQVFFFSSTLPPTANIRYYSSAAGKNHSLRLPAHPDDNSSWQSCFFTISKEVKTCGINNVFAFWF